MRDFTLKEYSRYIDAILNVNDNILQFQEYFNLNPKPDNFVVIRHDVDRMPYRALNMAKLESKKGIKSTYYFRSKKHTFKPKIIKEISSLGHEIGYHYESLSDANGDMALALADFEKNLNRFREIVPIQTISMHGRPLNNFDNRDLWKDENNHQKLLGAIGILGEVYLDIDYSGIAYINDTGRNWLSTRSNLRDKIDSAVNTDFATEEDLFDAFCSQKFNKIIFQVHPERWNDGLIPWLTQYSFDLAANTLKALIR